MNHWKNDYWILFNWIFISNIFTLSPSSASRTIKDIILFNILTWFLDRSCLFFCLLMTFSQILKLNYPYPPFIYDQVRGDINDHRLSDDLVNNFSSNIWGFQQICQFSRKNIQSIRLWQSISTTKTSFCITWPKWPKFFIFNRFTFCLDEKKRKIYLLIARPLNQSHNFYNKYRTKINNQIDS